MSKEKRKSTKNPETNKQSPEQVLLLAILNLNNTLTRSFHEIMAFYPLSLALICFVFQKSVRYLTNKRGSPCVETFLGNKILNKLFVNIAVLAEEEENASIILRLGKMS